MSFHPLKKYTDLLKMFTSHQITASEFEREYLALFKNDATIRPEAEFLVLDELFANVDALCLDPEIRDENDLSEDQLRQKAKKALEKLR